LKAVEVSLNSKGELHFINAPYKISDRTFVNLTYICLIALSKDKVITVLNLNQQDEGDRTNLIFLAN
jgi:hypothetical protein